MGMVIKGESKQINKGYIDFLLQPMKRIGLESVDQVASHLNGLETSFAKGKNTAVKSVVNMPAYSPETQDDPEELAALRKAFAHAIATKGDK